MSAWNMRGPDTVKRRDFITLAGAAAMTLPRAARAQQPERRARIGYLGAASGEQNIWDTNQLLAGLREFGYVDGKNLQIEVRFADGDEGRLPGLAAELVALNVDVIVASATAVAAAHRTTTTIPIVQAVGPDLVESGIAASLAHPGGNGTGLTFFFAELMAKRMDYLKQ